MITAVLERARRRAQAADALLRRSETTTVAFESGRLKAAAVSEEAGVNLRMIVDGRLGVAGTTALAAIDDLVERGAQSAALGERVGLAFPAATRFPALATLDPATRDASLDDLVRLGRALVERLRRDGCQVNVAISRAVGEKQVGNTRGGAGAYEATEVDVLAEVTRIAADDVLMVGDQYAGPALPSHADVEHLVRSIADRLDRATTLVEPPSGSLPVLFTPAGSAALFLPLEQGLSGKALVERVSPLAGKVGEPLFHASFSLLDDPLVPNGPASRPFDDEGVPSGRTPLVERGVLRGFVYDLETAERAGTTSTGHGRRSVFGKPQVSFSNLVVGGRSGEPGAGRSGDARWPYAQDLVAGISDGLVVDELIGVGQGNVMGGAFSHPVALAYRVRHGEIVGRVKHAAVAGNVYELFQRGIGWGRRGRWAGTRWQPAVLLDGVSLAG